MERDQIITVLNKLRASLQLFPSIDGKADLEKSLRKSVSYLADYKVNGTNIPDLIYRDRKAEYDKINSALKERVRADEERVRAEKKYA